MQREGPPFTLILRAAPFGLSMLAPHEYGIPMPPRLSGPTLSVLGPARRGEEIVASERDSSLRVSLHLYNTDDDVDAVLAALARQRQLLL